jgi:TrmH family RNA methyltransferase
LKRLSSQRRYRLEESRFVVEGPKLLHEALDCGGLIEAVYLDAGSADEEHLTLAEKCGRQGARVHFVESGVLARVCESVTPQPLAAIVATVDLPLPDLRRDSPRLVLVPVGLQDPGNAGALMRSAAAAGVGAVVFTEGSVDVYNPKAVRASAGTIFRVPVSIGLPPLGVVEELLAWGLQLFATTPRSGAPYYDADLTRPSAVFLGGEASGLPTDVEARLSGHLTIPMGAGVESLNVAMAATVICFEAARQRRAETTP